MRSGLLLTLFFGFALGCFGQECAYELRGVVEDEAGDELAGATVLLREDIGAVTSADGSFRFEGLCPGVYNLLIKFVGYEDITIPARVPASRQVVIKLKSSVHMLHDIVVQGQHSERHGVTQSLSFLSDEELTPIRGKALGEMLQEVPGVNSIVTGPAIFKPVIHGLFGQRILILNNGVRQEGQQWGIEHAPEIDSYVASELEVVKGSESVRYGADAMGGVILVNPMPLHFSPGTGGEINIASASNNRMGAFSGMFEGGVPSLPGWGWRVQGTLKKGGDFHTPEYNLSNTGMTEGNLSFTTGFRKERKSLEVYLSTFNTRLGILRAAHTGNLNDLQESIERERPWFIREFSYDINNPRQAISHHLGKLKTILDISPQTKLQMQYAFQYNQRREFDIRRGSEDVPSLSLNLFSHLADVVLDREFGSRTESVGINITYRDNDNVRGSGLLPDYAQFTSGIFFTEKIRRQKWVYELGGRYDYQQLRPVMFDNRVLITPAFSFHYFSATAGASVHPGPAVRLSSNLSFSSRPPHVSELYSQGLHHGAASIEEGLMLRNGEILTGRNNINTETSFKWVNTFQWNTETAGIELTAYANALNNYVFLAAAETRLTIRGFFPVFQHRQTNAFMGGSDLTVSYRLSESIQYSGRLSLLYATDRSEGNRLPFVPPANTRNSVTWTYGNAGKMKSIFVSLISDFTAEQKSAPRTIYPEELSGQSISETFDFMPAPSSYFLLSLRAGFTVPSSNRDFNVSFSVDNLLDTVYRNYMNRLRYFADEPGRNFSIRLRYKFHSH